MSKSIMEDRETIGDYVKEQKKKKKKFENEFELFKYISFFFFKKNLTIKVMKCVFFSINDLFFLFFFVFFSTYFIVLPLFFFYFLIFFFGFLWKFFFIESSFLF